MKNNFLVSVMLLSCLYIILAACKKSDQGDVIVQPSQPPVVETSAVTEITKTSAMVSGRIVSNNGDSIIEYGICFDTLSMPTIDDRKVEVLFCSQGSFECLLENLMSGTTYYVRAYAVNSSGVAYGEELSFTTVEEVGIIYGDGVTDVEGNQYVSVIIGDQEWMASNLKTTKYNNGIPIPNVTLSSEWKQLTTPAYCWYDNDSSTYGDLCGALYNWFTVETGDLCPTGWHVPTDDEWAILINYVGGDTIAGLKLKAAEGWYKDGNGTDDYGFSAIPGGYRYDSDGNFHDNGRNAYGWSSTEKSETHAWYRYMRWSIDDVYRYGDRKGDGYGVRCIKD